MPNAFFASLCALQPTLRPYQLNALAIYYLEIRERWQSDIRQRCAALRIQPPKHLEYMTGAELSACNRSLLVREARAGKITVLPGTIGAELARMFGDTDILSPPEPQLDEDERYQRAELERRRFEQFVAL